MYDVSFYTASTVNITVTMQKYIRGYNDMILSVRSFYQSIRLLCEMEQANKTFTSNMSLDETFNSGSPINFTVRS